MVPKIFLMWILLNCLSKPKIANLQPTSPSINKDILRLNISMYQSFRMNLLKPSHKLLKEVEDHPPRQEIFRIINDRPQCFALRILHQNHNVQTNELLLLLCEEVDRRL